jgi:hypothetical protein
MRSLTTIDQIATARRSGEKPRQRKLLSKRRCILVSMAVASGEVGPPGRRRRWALALLALAISTTGTLVVLELGIRIYRGDLFGLPNPALGNIRIIGARYPGAHDPRLGWVPEPGRSGRKNVWRTEVTITEDGLRGNGREAAPSGSPILAVGDSFTFGDEVDDADTWPARLEEITGRPVLNGGVFGYGLDQIVLRAESLLDRFPADTLVVSIIPNDVLRCEYAYRYAWKPYFEVIDGALRLQNAPVPEPHRGPPEEPSAVRLLRLSFLADLVMRRIDPDAWLLPESVRAHRNGEAVSRLLIDRLADRAKKDDLALLVVVQWAPRISAKPVQAAIERARGRGIEVLELEPLLRRKLKHEGVPLWRLFKIHAKSGGRRFAGHMTAAGNELVARAVADRLAEMAVMRTQPGRASYTVK